MLFSATIEGQIEVSPWEIHEGHKGIIDFKTSSHGDPIAYSQKNIPVDTDQGWKIAPKNSEGKVEIKRKFTIAKEKCNQQLDFTYFQAEVSIPQNVNVNVNEFTISYDKADDGARIYFFNSKYPLVILILRQI